MNLRRIQKEPVIETIKKQNMDDIQYTIGDYNHHREFDCISRLAKYTATFSIYDYNVGLNLAEMRYKDWDRWSITDLSMEVEDSSYYQMQWRPTLTPTLHITIERYCQDAAEFTYIDILKVLDRILQGEE